MKLISLQIDNVMRIVAAYIEPKGNAVFIGGPNAAGKTAVLKCIGMLFKGKKAIPKDAIHHGAKKGKIVGVTEKYVISLVITEKDSYLDVENRDGTPLDGTPQAILNGLVSKLSFDPLEFWAMSPEEQVEVLKRLMGLDFTELDADRERIFAERKTVNAEVKRLKGAHQSMPDYPDAPAKEVDVAEVMAELKEAQAHNAEIENLVKVTDDAEERVNTTAADLEAARERIAELEEELATNKRLHADALAVLDDIEPKDTESLSTQITEAGDINEKVRAVKAKAASGATLRKAETRADALTADIADIDEEKRQDIANAKSPVAGLGFDETGPIYKDTPLEQASQAERIDVSLEIGAALNPELDVLCYQGGSLLDEDMRQLVVEKAAAKNMQVFLEVVGRDKDAQFIIVDGRVEGADDEEKVTEAE